jgi:hypothetical protein
LNVESVKNMSDTLQLILEDTDGTQLETSCTRVAVMWQGKELWIQQDGRGQLLIGVDVKKVTRIRKPAAAPIGD